METLVILFILMVEISILYLFLKQNVLFPGFVFSLSLLLPIIVFQIDLDFWVYLIFCFASLVFFVGALLGWGGSFKGIESKEKVSSVFILFILLVGFTAFLLNIYRVLSELGVDAYLVSSSKSIELTFGRYTTINYLYFLLMLLPSLVLVSKLQGIIKFFLIVAPLLMLTLNGIKSTFLFALTFTLFTYFQVNGMKVKYLFVTAPVVLVMVTLMFVMVNMGGEFALSKYYDLLYGYVGINYKNFELELTERENFTYGKYTFFFLTKLQSSEFSGGYYASNDFYLLDPDFNMGTVLREFFVDFDLLGVFIILLFLGLVSGWVFKYASEVKGVWYIISSVFLTASLFAFFGNQFIRLQFIWLVLILLLFDFIERVVHVRN